MTGEGALDAATRSDLEVRLGSEPIRVEPVAGGGFSCALRRRVTFADGRQSFVKVAGDSLSADWLRTEQLFYRSLTADFLPAVYGYGDGATPWLALEFLDPAGWPPPWPPSRIRAVRGVLELVHATQPPRCVKAIDAASPFLTGWRTVAHDPSAFLTTGVCDEVWLDRHLPVLLAACEPRVISGDALLHLDVRSDNVWVADDRVVLVDWNWAAVGNPDLDAAFWAPSLCLETGLRPDDPALDPRLAAVVAGFFAGSAGLPEPPKAPGLRGFQRAQLAVALPWAARALGLPEPLPRSTVATWEERQFFDPERSGLGVPLPG
jgi:hypothetical protein